MVVVLNVKGTSVPSFQIGKQGPIVKNNANVIAIRDKDDAADASLTADSITLGAATGDDQGPGTVNATAYFINGVEFTSPQLSFNSDTFTGTGLQTAFTLSTIPVNEDAILVAVSGLVQDGGVDYTVSGTTLTFTTAPPNTAKILVLFRDALVLSSNSVTTKIGAYTTIASDDVVFADSTLAEFTITLGSAAVISGNQITVKDSGGNSATNNIIIATEAAETIDGAVTLVLANDFESYTLISNGTNWFINGHVQPADLGSI